MAVPLQADAQRAHCDGTHKRVPDEAVGKEFTL